MKLLQRGFLLLMLAVASVYFSACVSTKLPENYTVDPEVLEAQGGTVEFTITGTIPPKTFNKKAVVEFSPYVKYNGERKALKKFVLRGEKTDGEGTVINAKTGGSFTYTESFAYADDMRTAELFVDAKVSKGSKSQDYNEIKLADGIISTYKNMVHDEKSIWAPSGYEKVTVVSKTAPVYFNQNRANISWASKLNALDDNKAKLDALDDFLMKGWEIQDIVIDGWASPEGEIDFNNHLADDRAASVNKYMDKKVARIFRKRAKDAGVSLAEVGQMVGYQVKGHGEDWDGFMNAVKASDLQDKNTIVNVVNAQNDVSRREQEIRNMTVIYQEVEKEILPSLRRAEITVNCFEPKRSNEEIARLATSAPDSLSYKELLYAATLTDNHEARYNIYRAGFLKPDRDWKTYHNAAVEDIELDMIDVASNLLNQAEALSANNGTIKNNYGVVASNQGDYAKAEEFFMNAQKLGADENYNLGMMAIQNGNYEKALTYFGNIKCKHNVGLAQLLSGKTNEAMNTLKCAPESSKTFYMLAVYGARTNNADMVYEYLGKAFAMNPEAKQEAASDREFLKYSNEAAFLDLIN